MCVCVRVCVCVFVCVTTHQTIDPSQGVVGVVHGVSQLVHSVVSLTVAIETHTYRHAVREQE